MPRGMVPKLIKRELAFVPANAQRFERHGR
jgi:hypothetical protein